MSETNVKKNGFGEILQAKHFFVHITL